VLVIRADGCLPFLISAIADVVSRVEANEQLWRKELHHLAGIPQMNVDLVVRGFARLD